MAKCNLGEGKSVYFWTDLWNEKCLHKKLPHLASYARHANTTVNEAIQNEFLEDLFQLPLSQQAYEEFLELQIIYDEAKERIALGNKDQWSYIWESDEFYCKKAYKVLQGEITVIPHFKWIWESSCQAKHKFFFWLLLIDRLNTRNLLTRKIFNLQSYLCATLQCPQEETLIHLFWTCPFAAQCWDYVCPQRTRNLSVHEAFYDIKIKLQVPFYMDIMILAAWSIWIVRNNKIFNNQMPSFASWKSICLQELRLVSYRMRKKYTHQFKVWLETQT